MKEVQICLCSIRVQGHITASYALLLEASFEGIPWDHHTLPLQEIDNIVMRMMPSKDSASDYVWKPIKVNCREHGAATKEQQEQEE